MPHRTPLSTTLSRFLTPLLVAALLGESALHAQSPRFETRPSEPAAAEIISPRPTFPRLTPPPTVQDTADADTPRAASSRQALGSTVTVASSLAVVLGLFAGLIWLTRRFGSASGAGRSIPRDACEVLGTTAIDPRLKVTLLRVGGRVVVLAQTPTGVHPISEIAAPDEAQRLIATCRGESAQNFAQELKAIEREAYRPGFIEPESEPPATQRRRLFATA